MLLAQKRNPIAAAVSFAVRGEFAANAIFIKPIDFSANELNFTRDIAFIYQQQSGSYIKAHLF